MRAFSGATRSLYGSRMAMIWWLVGLGFVIMFFNALPAIIIGLFKIAVGMVVVGVLVAIFFNVIYGKD